MSKPGQNTAENHDLLVQADHVLKLFGSYVGACELVSAGLLSCFLLGQLSVVHHQHNTVQSLNKDKLINLTDHCTPVTAVSS